MNIKAESVSPRDLFRVLISSKKEGINVESFWFKASLCDRLAKVSAFLNSFD